ncbi:MAG: mannose-6-phosphate isomerase, partial [Treponema sp.]|nr:mannose-6-phosphate isomerase [Treponema sp.]
YVKEPTPLNKNKTINKNFIQLVSSRFFSVWVLDVKLASDFVQDQAFMIATVIDGHGTVSGHTVKKGSCFIIPFEYGKVFVEGNLRLIISSP